MDTKEKNPVLDFISKMGKWFWAFVAAAVLLVGTVITLIVVAVNANKGPDTPDTPDVGGLSASYYYDTQEGEYTLALTDKGAISLSGPNLNLSGLYTVNGESIAIDFEDSTASATMDGDTLVLTYNGADMRFFEKVWYTVSFNVGSGSPIDNVKVLNGKTASKPSDPTLDGSVFLGWFADAGNAKAFMFDSTVISGDTTVYAKWAVKAPGQSEYNVSLDLGYEAAAPAGVTTVGGKLAFSADYTEPVREGYTFAGWYVSMYEDGEKLTSAAAEGMDITADTTLFATWIKNDAKITAPSVSISGGSISWSPVNGAQSYKVTVANEDGTVKSETIGATTYTFDFSSCAQGDYTVTVEAIGASESASTVRYYRNKSLDRVTGIKVIGSSLIFDAVKNAEKYLITIDCGNDEHEHTMLDNGKSTVYNFANCQMQANGITFTVVAVADSYASSVPASYNYVLNLDKIDAVVFNEATETFTWGAVANAERYYVTVTCGNHTHTAIDNGNSTDFSIKGCSGDITISVYPATAGYNSPEATSASCTKLSPATPSGLTVHNMTASWDAVDGADSYVVKIDGKPFTVIGECEFDLTKSGITFTSGSKYSITVSALKGSDISAESDALSVSYLTIGSASYYANTFSWAPVAGVTNFEVQLNDNESFTVSGVNSVAIVLDKAGVNTIKVKTADFANNDWVTVNVTAYEITYESRTPGGFVTEYLAVGDTMNMPTDFTFNGYDLTGWYNAPGAANGNGSKYESATFTGSGPMTLWANWTPKTYNIEIAGIDETMSGAASGDKFGATYTKDYTLPVLTTTDKINSSFAGWYTRPDGKGVKLTDHKGNSVATYSVVDDSVAYPYFTSGMIFVPQADGTYAVTQGKDVDIIPEITIPVEYDGKAVTAILENGFYNCDDMIEINIPDTITLIGAGAFNSCDALKNINVYAVETATPHEVVYSSVNGILLYTDTTSDITYLELYPRAKTGAGTVPEEVDVIRNKAFYYAKLSSLTISKNVYSISTYAFGYCRNLTEIVFEEGGNVSVAIANNAFYNCSKLKSITLPARLHSYEDEEMPFDTATLDYLTALETINVCAAEDAEFSAVEGMLCNGIGNVIVYCPKAYPTVTGELYIPVGITGIGDGVFRERNTFTEITIPNYVDSIGKEAFYGCKNIKSVTIAGSRNKDLTIGDYAFYGCGKIREITFEGNSNGTADVGATTIGASAFAAINELRAFNVKAGANIEAIGSGAFKGCGKLRTIGIEDGTRVNSIKDSAFSGCEALLEFTIPNTTTSIESYAFEGCTLLKTIVFAPNGKDIDFGSYVFKDCVGIATIELPATVQSFNGSAFDGCYSIREISVAADNAYLESIDGVLYNESVTEIMFYPKSKTDADLSELPWNTLQVIGDTVFKDNTSIQSISIPKNVTVIGDSAFNGCINLESITFENGGTAMTVGAYAFANCSKLTSIVFPDYLVSIGDNAFRTSALETISLPDSLDTIGNFAFAYSNVASINIPKNVTLIGDGAFAYSKLSSITIADGTTELKIGSVDTFEVNYDFESLIYNVYNGAPKFPADYIDKNAVGVFRGTSVAEINLPARVTSIGAFAFYGVVTTDEDGETIPMTVTIAENSKLSNIGTGAFYGSAITSINLENSALTSISDYAFATSSLEAISIPKTITNISKHAFEESALTEIDFEMGGTEPLFIGNSAFKSTYFTSITLPKTVYGLTDPIMIVSGSAPYGFEARSFYTIFDGNTSLSEINVEEGNELYGSRDGIFYEKDENGNLTILVYCPKAKTGDLVIPKEVTYVEHLAFTQTSLTSIAFEEYDKNDTEHYGKPLLTIGGGATTNSGTRCVVIGNTDTLKSVKFPSHLKRLGSFAVAHNKAKDFTIEFNLDASPIELEVRCINDNKTLKTLNLPAVASMGDSQFSFKYTLANQSALETITFAPGSTVTEIPYNCFAYCSSLKSIEIPASVEIIDRQAFYSCKALESVTFETGSKITTFNQQVFYQCTALKEFTFPDSVLEIGYGIFDGCTSITKVTLPKSITTTEVVDAYNAVYSIFYGCASLENIEIADGNSHLKNIGGAIFDSTETILFAFPAAKVVEGGYVLPDTVKQIAPYAFNFYCNSSVTLNEGLTVIGKGAFFKSMLTEVAIPASVTMIDGSAFHAYNKNFSRLTSVEFAENGMLTTLGGSVFAYQALTEVTLPNTITTIGTATFHSNKNLTKVTLPENLTALPGSTFYSCEKLEEVIIQSDITSIGSSEFGWSAIKHIELPSSVMSLGTQAFYNCKKLESITFPEDMNLASIGNMMFYNASSLKEITFPAALSEIAFGAFQNCAGLEKVDFSKTQITSLSSKTNTSINGIPQTRGFFQDCPRLTEVLLPETLEKIEAKMFMNCTSLEEINIPEATVSIQEFAFENCTSLSKVLFAQNSNLEIIGDSFVNPGSMDPDFEAASFRGTTALKEINIPEGVTFIGANLFENSGVEKITFPSTLYAISNNAFKNCQSLAEINIPGTISSVGENAFLDCVSLNKVTLNEGNEYLGANAFGNCAGITEITIPSSMLRMGGNPFANCTNITKFVLEENENFIQDATGVLYDGNMRTVIFYPSYLESESYEMPDTVFELAASAFASSKLKSVVISDNIKIIPNGCFKDSANLESVYIPLSVTYVGDEAFSNCAKLKSAAIPSLCTYLGSHAFENCTSLESFDFGKRNTVLEVGTHVFNNCTSLTSITDPEGINKLTDYMFANTGFDSINIPATITNMSGIGIFENCKNLRTVTFADDIQIQKYTGLGGRAFYGCEQLESITLPDGISELGDWNYGMAFGNCTNLKYVYLPGTCSYIAPSAFYNCTALETVELDERYFWSDEQDVNYEFGMYGIGAYAFYNCISLKRFEFPPESLGDVYPHAFDNCISLDGVYYIKGWSYLYGSFFKNCTGIDELHLCDGFDGNWNADCDETCTEWYDDSKDNGSFYGWTADQKVFFDDYTYEEILDEEDGYWYTWFDADCPEEVMFANSRARVFDCNGNEFIYDFETGGLIHVLDSEGNIIYTPEVETEE